MIIEKIFRQKIVKYLIIMTFVGPAVQIAKAISTVKIWTTHPQVTFDLQSLYAAHKVEDFSAQTLFNLKDSDDIHQFEPSPKELKILNQFSPLVIGPEPHQKWITQAKKAGLLSQAKTHFLNEQSHYWLEPKEALAFEREMVQFFKKIKPELELDSTYPWSKAISEESQKMKDLILKKGLKKIVLGHNALAPLFSTLENIEVIILYNEDHHQEISAQHLKTIFGWSNPPHEILFIFEKNLSWPKVLSEEKFSQVHKIHWSPLGIFPLQDLRKKLEELK
jgi:ABC-type Zn uptake system ZnuABC Zn-binding protein ZnuA